MQNIYEIVLFRRTAAPWWCAMGIARAVLVVALLLIPVCTFAQNHAVITPGQLVWKPLIPGVEMAVVSGAPDKKGGLYVIRIRSKGEVKVPPHWHPTDEHITVLAGSFLVARGDKYDAAKLVAMNYPAASCEAIHYAGCHRAV